MLNKKETDIDSCAKEIVNVFKEKIDRQIPNAIALGAIGVWDIICAYIDDIDSPNNDDLQREKAINALLDKLRKEKQTLIDRRKNIKFD